MDNTRLNNLVEQVDKKEEIREGLVSRVEKLVKLAKAGVINKPRLFNRCPECWKKLQKRTVYTGFPGYDLCFKHRHYMCSCGYEYGKKD